MKQKDVITGWLVAFIISCMMLAGCTEKARKLEKKNVKVETISVGNTNLGGTKDYVGTIEGKDWIYTQLRDSRKHHFHTGGRRR